MSRSVKFYYCLGAIYFVENNEVYYIRENGVIHLSLYSLDEVEQTSWFQFIEEVFNY